MSTTTKALLGAITLALSVGVLRAQEAVAPSELVSPGSADGFETVGGPCPTFSWAGSGRSASQQLVVYEVDETGAVDTVPVIAAKLPALASSWTPSRDLCFERGKSYAWSMRTDGGSKDEPLSSWAAARFFTIPAGPSDEDFAEALEVVRAFTALRGAGSPARDVSSRPVLSPDTSPSDASVAGPAEDEASDTRVRSARAGLANVFRVTSSKAVEAASFEGDGSALYNIGAAALAINAVGSAEIQTDAVGALEIANNAIDEGEIVDGSVGSAEIATGAVGASEIAPNAVGASEMDGGFCLVKRQSSPCPDGYSEQSVTWDTEDSGNADTCDDDVGWCGNSVSFLTIWFCCA